MSPPEDDAAPTQSLNAQLERRYLPKRTPGHWAGYGFAAAACALLGASFTAPSYQATLALIACVAFPVGWWLWQPRAEIVRVGPAGIGLERGGEIERIRWCDVDKLATTLSYLEIHTPAGTRYVSLDTQPMAAARIIAEAAQRIMTKLEMSRQAHDRLPKLDTDEAPTVPAAELQIAGARCAHSGEAIAMEADARLCPRCTATYHREHVPSACDVCGAGLDGKTWAA